MHIVIIIVLAKIEVITISMGDGCEEIGSRITEKLTLEIIESTYLHR